RPCHRPLSRRLSGDRFAESRAHFRLGGALVTITLPILRRTDPGGKFCPTTSARILCVTLFVLPEPSLKCSTRLFARDTLPPQSAKAVTERRCRKYATRIKNFGLQRWCARDFQGPTQRPTNCAPRTMRPFLDLPIRKKLTVVIILANAVALLLA